MPLATAPRKYSYLPSGKARKKLGLTLAEEMGAIIDRVGADHPNLNEHILRYIEGLDEAHPEWAGLWDRGTSENR